MSNTWNIRSDGKDALITTELTIVDPSGRHNACGETSNGCLQAGLLNGYPNDRFVEAICLRDRGAGLTDPNADSQTIENIRQDLIRYCGFDAFHLYYYPFGQYGTDQVATVSRWLTGHQGGIIIEFSQAYKLPFMEPGVNYHFCCLAAYDDTHPNGQHFYLCNPDRVPQPRSPYAGDWVSIQQLAAAGVCGLIGVMQ